VTQRSVTKTDNYSEDGNNQQKLNFFLTITPNFKYMGFLEPEASVAPLVLLLGSVTYETKVRQ
jgi:hypothetical protein